MRSPREWASDVWSAVKGNFGISWGGPGAETWQFAQNFVRGMSLQQGKQLTEPYRQNSAISVAVSGIAEDAAAVGWEFFAKAADGELSEEPISAPVARLWENPSPSMNGLQFFTGTYIVYQLFGEAFWYFPDLVMPRRGAEMMVSGSGGLMLLDPREVVHKAERGQLAWTLRTASGDIPLDPDRLTHFKRFNPYSPGAIRGLSKIESILIEALGDHAAQDWNASFYNERNGIPGGLLVPSISNPVVDPRERERYLRQWNDQHGHRRSVGMLPAGWDWKDLGITARDMDFRGLREYSREQILGLMGYPPFMAGVLEKANYANAREQKEVYWQGTQKRFLAAICATINADFLPKIGQAGIACMPRWDEVNALLEDLSEKTSVAKEWFMMGLSKRVINERLDMGWDPDLIEDYETGYLPLGLAPVGEERTVPALPPAFEDDEDDRSEESPEDAPRESASSLAPIAKLSTARRRLVWRDMIARMRDLELAFDRRVRSHMFGLEKEVLSNVQGAKGWAARWKQGDDELGVIFDLLFDLTAADQALLRRVTPVYRQTLKRGGESVIADAGFGIDFNMQEPRVLFRLAELQAKIKGINRTIEAALRESLVEGVDAGESVADIAKRVREIFRTSMGRSKTIARTEVGHAFNSAREIGMRQAGVKRHQWVSARDEKTRDAHRAEDGQVVDIGAPFPNTGLRFPQDPAGMAEQVINCRCVAVPVVGEA